MPDVIANDIWVASAGGQKLVIRCEVNDLTWYEVRTIVSRHLGVEPFSNDLTIETKPSTRAAAGAEARRGPLDRRRLRARRDAGPEADARERAGRGVGRCLMCMGFRGLRRW